MELKVSIVVCAYNSGDFLAQVLDSLANQSLVFENYEIIVVNNNSTDNTEEVALNFKRINPRINFQYFIEQKQGLSFARNLGISIAKGKYIAFIDDDATANFDYAGNILKAFEEYQDFSALGGKVNPVFESEAQPKWISKYVWGMIGKIDNGSEIGVFRHKYPAGCNMAFRKDVFDIVGNFNTNLTYRCDDKYIFDQIKKKGLKILYYPSIVVDHYIPKQRVSEEGIVNLAKSNGYSYRILIGDSFFGFISKLLDYFIKIIAALFLAIIFYLKGEPEKAKIVKIMYYSLVGFMSK